MKTRYMPAASDGWREDGHPHERTEGGFCMSCGASKHEYHYRLKPKETIVLEFTPRELAELYVILSGNHDIPEVYLSKVGTALKEAL